MKNECSSTPPPRPELSNNAETKNRPAAAVRTGYSGGGIRTRDLRVMSPTSYQAAPPRGKAKKYKAPPQGRQPPFCGD
jgi:hypothetical protein